MKRIPPLNTNGAPNHTKTADHIFMKILPEMYIGIRTSSLRFRKLSVERSPCLMIDAVRQRYLYSLSAPLVIINIMYHGSCFCPTEKIGCVRLLLRLLIMLAFTDDLPLVFTDLILES